MRRHRRRPRRRRGGPKRPQNDVDLGMILPGHRDEGGREVEPPDVGPACEVAAQCPGRSRGRPPGRHRRRAPAARVAVRRPVGGVRASGVGEERGVLAGDAVVGRADVTLGGGLSTRRRYRAGRVGVSPVRRRGRPARHARSARLEADQVTSLVDGVEGLVAAHLAAHLDTVVEALDDLLRRRGHRHVGVGDVEDLEAEPVGLQAALHHLPQVADVDVGEDVAPPQRRVGQERREHLGVLVGLDDVVDPQAVDVGPGAGLERARRHLVGHLGRRVGVLGHRRVLLVDGHVERLALALGEADAVRRLRRREDHLLIPSRVAASRTL